MLRPHSLRRADRSRPRSHAERAADAFAAGEYLVAEKCCRRALAQLPTDSDLWHLLADVHLAADELVAAATAIGHARQLAPNEPDYANTEALILEHTGAVAAADAAWRALLIQEPYHPDACFNLGRLLLGQGQSNDAVAYLERALILRPHWAEASRHLGQALTACGNRVAAERAFIAAGRGASGGGRDNRGYRARHE